MDAMRMRSDVQPTKEIVTVSEMARMCGLSRSRFYKLMQESVFPQPQRNTKTKRPYYDRDQQEQCLKVRRSNLGINGKAVMFYALQPQSVPAPKIRQFRKIAEKKQSLHDSTIAVLKTSLSELGIKEISTEMIRRALTDTFPDGYESVQVSELVTTIFRYLKRRNSHDNVT